MYPPARDQQAYEKLISVEEYLIWMYPQNNRDIQDARKFIGLARAWASDRDTLDLATAWAKADKWPALYREKGQYNVPSL